MSEILVSVGLVVVLVALLRALLKTRKQAWVMKVQSHEIKKQMLELENRNQELQKLNHEKLQIISLVSHDLKGPFNRIFALVQLMGLGQNNLTDEQKEYLGKIQQISADGLVMIRNILDSRRLDDKGIELHPVNMDLSAMVTSLVKNYRSIAEKKKIEFVLDIPEPVFIKADKIYLGRVVENLFSNAIKFSPYGKKIFVNLAQSRDGVALAVRDEGPGINAEDQKKMYQRFQRLSARTTGGESSTGLGLFIIKTIVDKIGGEIRCDSVVDEGTCFTVRLPSAMLTKEE